MRISVPRHAVKNWHIGADALAACQWRLLFVAALVWSSIVRVAFAEPDEGVLGKAQGYPIGTPATMYQEVFKVGSFSATEKILPTRWVRRSETAIAFEKSADPGISYRFQNDPFSIDEYLNRQRAMALLILKDGKIVVERYRYGRSAQDRFLSFSMSKSVTSLLIGIVLQKGMILSLDDTAQKYVPELNGSAYGRTTIRQLLRMSSGVKFVEQYDGRDDIARLMQVQRGERAEKTLPFLAAFQERSFPAGTKFTYASSESTILGYILARATGKDLTTLTRDWLWQPIGAEADAAWNINSDGQEQAEGRFSATLRDYGRLGVLLANDGRVGDQTVVPAAYLQEATAAARQSEAFRPGVATNYFGYGYQFWLFPLRMRTFACLGVYGQSIFVQPETKIVMVQLSVTELPIDLNASREKDALWRGVLTSLGGSTEP